MRNYIYHMYNAGHVNLFGSKTTGERLALYMQVVKLHFLSERARVLQDWVTCRHVLDSVVVVFEWSIPSSWCVSLVIPVLYMQQCGHSSFMFISIPDSSL